MRGPEGVSKGYGFAEMIDVTLTDKVIATLHGLPMGTGRTITVSRATGAKTGGAAAPGGAPGGGQPFGLSFQPQQQQQQPYGYSGSAGNSAPLGQRAPPGLDAATAAAVAAAQAAAAGYAMPPPPSGMMPPPPQQHQQQQAYASGSSAPSGLPSRVVVLDGMVGSAEELLNDSDYQDLVEDVASECSKYGPLGGVQVPRPPSQAAGRVFLQYQDMESAINAATKLAGRQFGGAAIRARYYDEGMFRAGQFSA